MSMLKSQKPKIVMLFWDRCLTLSCYFTVHRAGSQLKIQLSPLLYHTPTDLVGDGVVVPPVAEVPVPLLGADAGVVPDPGDSAVGPHPHHLRHAGVHAVVVGRLTPAAVVHLCLLLQHLHGDVVHLQESKVDIFFNPTQPARGPFGPSYKCWGILSSPKSVVLNTE